MTIAGGVVIFIVWWWVAFLAVLPRGIESRWEAEDDGVKGADPGAPVQPDLKNKAWLATKITAVLWVITVAIILSGVINFRD
jgi:predicted secreted protein